MSAIKHIRYREVLLYHCYQWNDVLEYSYRNASIKRPLDQAPILDTNISNKRFPRIAWQIKQVLGRLFEALR